MKKIMYVSFVFIILLFSSLTSFQSYAVDRSCAEALGLGQELKAFYAQRDVFFKDPSPDNVNQVVLLHNNLWDKANTVRNTHLHLAASKNDIPLIRRLVSSGVPVDVRGQAGATPLSVAAAFGHIEAIDTLLELGADINAPDAVGSSPLFYGVASGRGHAVEHLLRKGADINQANLVNETSIMVAVKYEQQDIFRTLASRGANLMSTNINGWTLLHKAINDPAVTTTNRASMVETILDTVTDWPEPGIINWPDSIAGASPLHWAAYYGRTETLIDVIDVLLQRGAHLNATNKDGELPIHVAARADQKDAFLKLRDADPESLKAKDGKGRTPIDTVREHKSNEILLALFLEEELRNFEVAKEAFLRVPSHDTVDRLTETYNDLSEKSETFPNTDLHVAVDTGNFSAIPHILSNGMSVNIPGQRGVRPLSVAAARGDIIAINFLLSIGADINAPDVLGSSPLHYASANGHVGVVLDLIEKGADVNLQNLYGQTPIMFAVVFGHQDVFRALASRGAFLELTDITVKTILHIALIHTKTKDRVGMIETILDTVTDFPEPGIINWPEPVYGGHPLHWAAREGDVDAIEILLRRGAHLNTTNKDGELPIHVAARIDRKDAFLKLRDANPESLKAKDNKGRTPIDVAREHNSQNVLSAF